MYVVEKMAHGYKRMGREAGAGFYDYATDPPQLWSGLKTFERRSRQLPVEDVRDRLLFAAVLAALRVEPSDAGGAVATALGSKVPVDRVAARAWLDAYGADRFVLRCAELTQRFGPRFAPPASPA